MTWLNEVDAQEAPTLTKGFWLSDRSMDNLNGVHKDLVAVVKLAIEITKIDFAVTEGLRSVNRQREMVAKGASQTMNSRHLTGHAVDLVAYLGDRISWEWPYYEDLNSAMQRAAYTLNVPIVWGGDWKMRDGPHFQLSWEAYPA